MSQPPSQQPPQQGSSQGSKPRVSPSANASSRYSHRQSRVPGVSQRRLSKTGAGHTRQPSRRDIVQKQLADMGSYHKYFKSILETPFQVNIRCECGRSRKPAWMFICTYCATGTKVKKEEKKLETVKLGVLPSMTEEEDDDDIDNNDNNNNDNDNNKRGKQRGYLCCDLCATKATESYYCPHCLAAFPAHYVKLGTRCTRCVSCPICTSPLEKIVYSGGSNNKKKEDENKTSPTDDKSKDDNNGDNNGDKTINLKETSNQSIKKKDVYLYQCPFCYWSSNTVGLEAEKSDKLLENLNSRLILPKSQMTEKMKNIKAQYDKINEQLRKKQEELHANQKRMQYGGRRGYGTSIGHSSNKSNSSGLKVPKSKKRGHNRHQPSIMSDLTSNSEIDRLNQKLATNFKKNHIISSKKEINQEPALDMRFVNQFHLKHYAPLEHQLNDPLFQHKKLDQYIPSRFHLMTKESYKCPNKECEKYVYKPSLRGRQATYDKRTAVLDYLPKIEIKLISGNLLAQRTSKILVMFTNRHLQSGKLKLDTSVNEKDKISTADVKCSEEIFEIDAANIHIKGGAKPLNKRQNGDYSDGKEAGIHFDVTSKLYSESEIKFSVKITFETVLEMKEDKTSIKDNRLPTKDVKRDLKKQQALKHEKISVILPYIVDFNLGPAKKPGSLANQQKTNNVTINNNNNNNKNNVDSSSTVDKLLSDNNDPKKEFYQGSSSKARTSKENLKD